MSETIAHRTVHIAQPLLGDDEWQALREPLTSGWLVQGPKVAAFEKEFAARHRVAHGIATTSCTTALHVALAALGVGPGDEVLVPSFTWIATANAVVYCGAIPIFVDVNRHTFNIDLADVARRVTARTKGAIPVHLFGLCADIDGLRPLLPAGSFILEDAACAAGGVYKGKMAGSLGHVGAFSFHPRKSITTGEGGMVTTDDTALAERIRSLRDHGSSLSSEQRHLGSKPYLLPEFNELGFNCRMTDLQAALGLVQITKLEPIIAERARRAAWYREALGDVPWLVLPQEPGDEGRHAWQSFVTYVDPERAPLPRNEIMEILQTHGIATRPGTHAVHMLGYYRERFGLYADDYPGARDCDRYTMTIPLHNRMVPEDFAHVSDVLHSIGR